VLEVYRRQARDSEVLDTLIAYLQARQPRIPNYRQRRIAQQYIGSGHVEKANDLIVARRQKGREYSMREPIDAVLCAVPAGLTAPVESV
jgi:hypothetical protein